MKPNSQTVSEFRDDTHCGRIIEWRVDSQCRTLYVKTTTHGMTLEWSGDLGDQDHPILGTAVTLLWGEEAEITTVKGQRFFAVRLEQPVDQETYGQRLRAAIAVGISGALWLFVTLCACNLAVEAFKAIEPDTHADPAGALMLAVISGALLLGWRKAVQLRMRKKSIGVRKLSTPRNNAHAGERA